MCMELLTKILHLREVIIKNSKYFDIFVILGGLSWTVQWLFGFLTFIPWSLLEKIITPELKHFLLNMTARLKAKQIRNDIGKL